MKDMLMLMGIKAKMTMKNFFTNERGDVNVVAIVVLIGVAVILAIVFKDAIAGVIGRLISSIETKAKGDLGLNP